MKINELYRIIKDRQSKLPNGSYVASLFKDGKDRMIQKVGEEAVETVIAAKNGDKKQIIYEAADLIFHLLVMLAQFGIDTKELEKELGNRS